MIHFLKGNVLIHNNKIELKRMADEMKALKTKRSVLRTILKWVKAKHQKKAAYAKIFECTKRKRNNRLLLALKSEIVKSKTKMEMKKMAQDTLNYSLKKMALKSLKTNSSLEKNQKAKLAKFQRNLLLRMWKGFCQEVKKEKLLNVCYNTVSQRCKVQTAYNSIKIWREELQNLRIALYEAGTFHISKLLSSTFRNWKLYVSFKHFCTSTQNIIAEKRIQRFKQNVWGAWANMMKDPERKLQKTALFFYLEHLYSKYMTKLKTYANQRKFQNGLYEYYAIRLKKKTITKLRDICQWNANARLILKNKKTEWKRKLLFELFMHGEAKKVLKNSYSQAHQFRSASLRKTSFIALKENVGMNRKRKARLSEMREQIMRRKNIGILFAWVNYYAHSKATKLILKSHKEKARRKTIIKAILKWKKYTSLKKVWTYLISKKIHQLVMHSYRGLANYAEKKKHKKDLLRETKKLHIQAILGRGFKALKHKPQAKKVNAKRASHIKLLVQKTLFRSSIEGLKRFSEIKKGERGKIQQIQASNALNLTRYYYCK